MISVRQKRGLAIGLFLSGLSSLSFECLWFRKLGLLLGSSHLASVYLLSLLMLGFALGAFLAPLLLQKYPYPLRLYGGLELFIGLYGGGSAFLLEQLPFYAFYEGRFFFGALMIVPPSLAMGATLPLLCDSLFAKNPKMSGKYYGLNTLGAVFGVWGCGFYFLPLLGMRGSFAFASILCCSVGFLFLVLGSSLRVENTPSVKEPFLWGSCLFYFSLGFIGLAYQTFWTRTLILILGSSVYAFSIVLLTFLFATALGSLIASSSFWRFQKKQDLGFLQVGGAFFGFGSVLYLSHLPDLFFRYFDFFGPRWIYLGQFVFCFLLMAPTCFLLGATFPTIVSLTPSHKRVSRLYMANTLGGAFAPFLLGILLMYVFSIHQALLTTILLQLLLGFVFLSWKSRLISVLGAFTLLFSLGLPKWDSASMTSANYLYVQVRHSRSEYLASWEQLDYKEGVSAIVTVDQKKNQSEFTKVLRINGKEASGYADLPTEVLLAHLPFAFHPDPKNALVIGFGGGITVGSTLLHRLNEVYCAELVPEVFEMEPYFHEINHRPLQQKEFIPVSEDGRIYLAGRKRPLDVIISQPSNPWISGASALFTQEFYTLGREQLSENGVFCQWMQTYEISWTSLGSLLKAFQRVFPYCYIYHPRTKADILLIGLKTPLSFDPKRLFEQEEIRQDLLRAQIETEADLINSFLLLPLGLSEKLVNFPSNTDNNGYVEFRTPYELFTSSYLENNHQLHQQRSSLLELKSEVSYEQLSENAFIHRELELAAYWALLALKENSGAKWARTRLTSFIQVNRLHKLPKEWQKEVGLIFESLRKQQESERSLSAGKLDETLTLLRTAVSLWMENQEAHLRLGMLFDLRYHQEARLEYLQSALTHLQLACALGGESPVVVEKCKNLCRNLIFSTYNQQIWDLLLKYTEEYKVLEGTLPEEIKHCLAEALKASAILAFQRKEWKVVLDLLKRYEEEIGKHPESLAFMYQESLKNWFRSSTPH